MTTGNHLYKSAFGFVKKRSGYEIRHWVKVKGEISRTHSPLEKKIIKITGPYYTGYLFKQQHFFSQIYTEVYSTVNLTNMSSKFLKDNTSYLSLDPTVLK